MAEIKPGDTAYQILKNPQYDPVMRALRESDPADADTVFNPLFQQMANNIHAIYQSAGNGNLLINGDFSVWQRGTEFMLQRSKPTYTADRWMVADCFKTDNTKVAPSDDVPPGETGKSISFVIKEAFTEDWLIHQYLEEKMAQGEKYTLSAWVKGPAGATIQQSLHNAKTPPYTLTGKWQFIQHTFIKDDAEMGDVAPIRMPSKAGAYYLKNVKLEKGCVATPFVNRPPGVELLLCQRYYLPLLYATKIWVTSGYKDELWCAIITPVPMRIAPILKNPNGFFVSDMCKNNGASDMEFDGNTVSRGNIVEFHLHKVNHGFTVPYVLIKEAGGALNADIYKWETPE